MWSHYARGHTGLAIEVDIPDSEKVLYKVDYVRSLSGLISHGPGSAIIETEAIKVLRTKTREWKYEQESRIITDSKYYDVPSVPMRILLGLRCSSTNEVILRKLFPKVEIRRMKQHPVNGRLRMA